MRLGVLLLCATGCRVGFSEVTPLDAPAGTIVPTTLSVEWSTPHSVMWRFDWSGDDTMLDHFEIVLGKTEDEVRFRDGVVVGPALRPELGVANLPDAGSRVIHALTPVTPGSTVFAQLIAYDKLGGAAGSPIAKTTVPGVPTHRLVLYEDTIPDGAYTLPAELVEATDMPHSGTKALRFVSSCPVDCFENLRIQNMAIPVTAVGGTFDSAYLELWIAPEAAPSYWSQARLCLTDCTAPDPFIYSWFTLRADAGYERVEVPLHVMLNSNDIPMAAANLDSPLFEWTIGGLWPLGSIVHVDDVSLYY